MNSLTSIMAYYVPLSHRAKTKELALSTESNAAFTNYLSPCDLTHIATVAILIKPSGT